MAFAGLKKQINKANQYVTEKMGAAEGTKLDDDFMDMERKTDITYELVEDLQLKTKEYLQPNPTARAKMAAVKGISKLSGQAKAATYPQPEGVLGEAMATYGRKLGDENLFGQALVEAGESMRQLADIKYSLDDNVKQNFLEPLHQLQSKDLKEVMHHRKKLHGRRLDYDCKKRKQTKSGRPGSSPFGSPSRSMSPSHLGSSVTEEEIKLAEEKFAESLHLAQMGMHNILDNDVEQISQLASFSESLLEYHKQCTDILKVLTETLCDKRNEAANNPKREFVPKTLTELNLTCRSDSLNLHTSDGGLNGNNWEEPPSYESVVTASRQSSIRKETRGGVGHPARTPVASPMNPTPNNLQWDAFPPSASAPGSTTPVRSPARTPVRQTPSCQAVYDFDPENPGELGFKEGDTITLLNRIDENWYEGSLDGKTGFFPVNYVQIVVPLP